MKNIHILPTDKASRVFITKEEGLGFDNQMLKNTELDCKNQNIYIISDEEIKEGNWFYDLDTKYVKIKQSWENSHLGFNGKKIILTTDQDLIKDGVQAIPDVFLEWFVKNPSCEEVEVINDTLTVGEMSKLKLGIRNHKYKIIVPKEEIKQECIITKIMQMDSEIAYKCLPKTLKNIHADKTAVDWLFLMLNNPYSDQEFANKIFNKAKEIEEKYIEKIKKL